MSATPYRLLSLCVAALFLLTTGLYGQGTEPVYNPEGEAQKLEQINREGRESDANRQAGEDVRGREEWFSFQRRFPYDMIPAGLRTQALRETQVMEQRMRNASRTSKREGASIQAVNRWESIGPSNIGGRVRAVAVQPGNPQIVYIGAAAGGVWKTTDGGTNWKTTTDTLGSLAIGAIAIDHSRTNTIYIGTGENTANIDAYLGAGLYKSTDGGLTWKSSGLETVGAISKIFVHRQNSNIIYVASAKRNNGFYRSEDGGATWKKIVTGDVFDLAVNPVNSNEVFISFANSIRRSTDAGKTFSTVNTGLTLTGGLRISIAISPAQTSRLYALIARDGGGGANHIGEAYVTTNSGANWTLKKTFDQFFFNRQGWYDNCIAVDPADPNVVLAGGIDVYRTIDGGNNWTNTTRSYFGGDVHPDQHVLEFDPQNSGVVFLGNDGGVYSSVDAGSSWQRMSLSLPITQYYAMEVDQTKLYRVYGGSQDNGTHGSYGTAGFTQDWKRILGGDGFYVAVDLSDPNVIYAEQFNGTPLYRIDANNTNTRSRIDGSISSDADQGDYGYWSTPIAMSPADKKTLYTGRTKLYRSTNRGSSWQALTPSTSTKISAIGLSPFDSKKIMVGTSQGEIAYTTNDGQSWARPTGAPSRFITDIVYDPVDPQRVYMTYSGSGGHVYRSNDNGASFENISANLPNTPVNAIAIDPRDNNHIFIGTDVGVFVSLDGGGYWIPFNDGLALAPVADLKIHSQSHTLFAATHGRSMFKVNITDIQAQPVLINPVGGITFNTPGSLPVRWVGLNGAVRILISYDGGRTYQVIADNVSGGADTLVIPNVRSSSVRIKVEEISGGRSVESEDFTLKATTNGTELGKKGFVAEAIEYRRNYMWATVRGSDSLFKLKLPLLSPRTGLVRTGIPGHVIDMAYDDASDRFYMLTANDDFSNPKLYRMDSNGVGHGQVALPEELLRASGVAMTDQGIALITPGPAGEVFIINDAGSIVRRSGALLGADEEYRRGLVWDRFGFVQGVMNADPNAPFPSELQIMFDESPLRVRESSPIVLTNVEKLFFFGLAFDPTNADVNKRTFWATDSSGAFFRFDREKFFTSSVEAAPGAIEYVSREVAIGTITPNPMRGQSEVHFTVRSRRNVTVELYDAAGTRVASLFEGSVEPGEHTARLDGDGLASGVYYVTLSGGAGERDVKPVVVMK